VIRATLSTRSIQIRLAKHNVHIHYLSPARDTETLAASFQHSFDQRLDSFVVSQWAEASIFKFIRREMSSTSVCAISWPSVLDIELGENLLTSYSHVSRLTTNTVPVCEWALTEVSKDPALFQATREEFLQALVTDPGLGRHAFDSQKLASLPLLQSMNTKSLHKHMSLNVTRKAINDLTPAGYALAQRQHDTGSNADRTLRWNSMGRTVPSDI
jgi:hypothetical protein